MCKANTIVILDFETTGLSPNMGDRAIEIAGVRLEDGEVIDSFQELMNPGKRISSFIEEYTGITNNMLKKAPPCDEVMERFSDFINGYNLVAHNAAFDKKFLDAELNNIEKTFTGEFVCSMLVARRIYQNSPNHKLETLVEHANIPSSGRYHRALYDCEMTTKLWLKMLSNIKRCYGIDPIVFKTVKKLSKTPKKKVPKFLNQLKQKAANN